LKAISSHDKNHIILICCILPLEKRNPTFYIGYVRGINIHLKEGTYMSEKKFKILDIFLFTIISTITECLNIWLFSQFGGYQIFTLSFVPVLGMIALFRWNAWGIVTPLVSSMAGILLRIGLGQNITADYWLIYGLSFLSLFLCLLWFRKKDKATILSDKGFFFGYYFTGYIALELTRGIIQTIASGSITAAMVHYFAYDLLNIVFNLAVFFIACKQETIVVDMHDYLVKLHSEPSSARMRKENNNYLALEQMANKNNEISDIALLDGGVPTEAELKNMSKLYGDMENKESFFRKENSFIKKQRCEDEKRKEKHDDSCK